MLVIRDPADATSIADPDLRAFVQKIIADLSDDYDLYDPEELGYFVIVQPGDLLAAINEQIGFDILANKWTGVRYDQPDYTQAYEILEEHAGFYELLFVIDQGGFGIEVFIPKAAGIDPDLIAMCAEYATPATTDWSASTILAARRQLFWPVEAGNLLRAVGLGCFAFGLLLKI